MRKTLITAFCTLLVGIPLQGDARHGIARPDLRLTIAAPESRYVRVQRRHGIKTLKYVNRSGILSTTQWPLVFRIESRTAVGLVAKKVMNQEREALILTDPDECLHLGTLLDDLAVPIVFDPTCPFEDETYIEIQTEKFDTFEVFDNDTTGNDVIRDRLDDDEFLSNALLNTPYLQKFNGKIDAVGPKTGGPLPPPDPMNKKPDERDGYGYGADDDLASMVIMADVGGARVFDEHFELLVPNVIRNMAGFINTVSLEDLDGRRQTAITASMHMLAGVFEPIAIVDADTADPAFEYAIRVDSGVPVAFNLIEPKPPVMPMPGGAPPVMPMPGGANAYFDELLSQYYPAEIRIRAVLVNGEAPDFVYDMNGDRRYTARDVELAGHQLLSNEVEINLTVAHENLLTDSADTKCPPRTFLHGDVDGNGKRGVLPECSGTSGSTRVRRPPR